MTPIEARELRNWIEDRRVVMLARIKRDHWVVEFAQSYGVFAGRGESEDFEEAIRNAQHDYDAALIEAERGLHEKIEGKIP